MPKVAKTKTREEKLAQARLHRREKYAEIKKDPEKYAAEKEKERLRYIKRKENKQLKNIQDLTPRAQRQQRKKWRENRKRYLIKKKNEKRIVQMLLDNSPPSSDDEQTSRQIDPLEGQSRSEPITTVCNNCVKKTQQIRRIRYIYNNRIRKMKNDIGKLQTQKAALQKALYRLKKQEESKINNPTTEEKVVTLIDNVKDNKNIEKVKKKLLFQEIITKELITGYKTLPKKDKQKFSNMIGKENFKKHKILNTITSFTIKPRKVEERQIQKIKQEIEDFFEDDSNSRIAADKKEFRKIAGLVKQKRYLNDTLINLHEKFLKTHDCKVGYSTFCKYRPFWVMFPKITDRNTCSCILHVNMDLLIRSLNQNKVIKETNGSSLLANLCCDTRREECLNRTCDVCNMKVINYGEFRNDTTINYYQWGAKMEKYTVNGIEKFTKKTTKSKLQDLPLNLIRKLEGFLPKYMKHCLNIVQQYKNITQLKKSLTPWEVLIHMDFSENYITKFHEEVQARHFGSSPEQITLHTSVAYLLDPETGVHKTYSMCTISDYNKHDAEAIWAHIIPILEHVKDISHIDTVHFVTDSPSSQYRNRKIFFIISQLQQQFPDLNTVTWNYLESGHGKGAPDGIGAVIKRTADDCVRFGKDVGTLQDFWHIMCAKMKNVKIHIVTKNDIMDKRIPQNIKTFKGTMSVHQVLWSANNLRITFRKLSCFFCKNGIDCAHGYHLGYMDVPDLNIEPKQGLLQDFLDNNTTPELIEEITNSPKRLYTTTQDSLNYEQQRGQSQNILETEIMPIYITKSPKVQILSDVRLHWSNTPFCSNVPSTSRKASFLQNYEKFLALPSKTEAKTGKGNKTKITSQLYNRYLLEKQKKETIERNEKNEEEEEKENEGDEDYDVDDLQIF